MHFKVRYFQIFVNRMSYIFSFAFILGNVQYCNLTIQDIIRTFGSHCTTMGHAFTRETLLRKHTRKCVEYKETLLLYCIASIYIWNMKSNTCEINQFSKFTKLYTVLA